MAPTTAPAVAIELGGRQRTLQFGFRAWHALEKAAGLTYSLEDSGNVIQQLLNKGALDGMSLLLWAGLLKEDKTLTHDAVLDMLDDVPADQPIMPKVLEALGVKPDKLALVEEPRPEPPPDASPSPS